MSRSGYYGYLSGAPKREERERKDLSDYALILAAYEYRGYDKGSRGIHMRLLRMGVRMNRKKIRRLMREHGLRCPIRKENPCRRMAAALRTSVVAENLLRREFRAHGPRKVLLTDITYIPLGEGHVYLSVIIDAFTTEVLAYVLSESLEVSFVIRTLEILKENHGGELSDETMIHSDQGCHYTSVRFREFVKDTGLQQSMSRRGNCWDNAPQESFFGHTKDELRKKSSNWNSYETIRDDIDDWMDYYNNDRYKEMLGKMAPSEYYRYLTTGYNPLEHLGT